VIAGSPRVNVLLPVKDEAATLGECLADLRAQPLEDHEVLAVDDGSTDGSLDILQGAAAADPRVRVLRAPAPGGLVAALNAGLAAARAPLLARMDADDRCPQERLAVQVRVLDADPGLQILGARVEAFGDFVGPGMCAYVEWSNTLLDDGALRRDLLVESPLVHPSVVARTATLRALGGYRDDGGPEDYDLWLRAAAAGARFGKCPEVLLRWRDRESRLTRRDPRYARERFFARKVRAVLEGPLREGGVVVIWGAGQIGKAWARALVGPGRSLVAFVEVDPRKLGQRIHGAPVIGLGDVPNLPTAAWHVAAVGQRGARERIRAEARARGVAEARLIAVA
jgi:glycosyltransferase involved in cell wall biosynthesis